METWRALHPRQILDVPGAISVHGGVSPGEPRTRGILEMNVKAVL